MGRIEADRLVSSASLRLCVGFTVAAMLAFLCPGCAQVPPKAASDLISPEAAAKLLEPGDIPKGVVDAKGEVDLAVWGHFLENLLRQVVVSSIQDQLGPGAMQAKSAPVVTVNPVVTTKLLDIDGTVIAVIVIAGLGLAFFILRSEFARRDARQWKDAAGVVMQSVEEAKARKVKEAVSRKSACRPKLKARLDGYLADQGYLSMGNTPGSL